MVLYRSDNQSLINV